MVDQSVETDPALAQNRLDAYGRQLNAALNGYPDDPIFREVAWAVTEFDIPHTPFVELLDGVRQDLRPLQYACWTDLARYCGGVASSVGEMCAYVFGMTSNDDILNTRTVLHARTLGLAMQLTNILRDIGEDARRGRCYLPTDELGRFGLSTHAVLERTRTLTAQDGWMPFMRFQIARARSLYAEATPGIAMLQADSQGCAQACADGYAGILDAIEAQQYDTISRRARIGTSMRMRLLFRAWRKWDAPATTSAP